MLQSPTLNPVSVELWHPKSDAVEHEFRHRFETRSTQFEVLVTLQAQCHFFSKDSLRRRQELGYIRSLGYIRVRKEDLVTLGELPIEEEWVAYKLLFPGLGSRFYDVIEARPKCPLDGDWLYFDLHFEESKVSVRLATSESTSETEPLLEQYTEVEVEDQ